ncbi:hypothetical protein M0638_15595 [Roseomonas sp. NAR14]|uniref:Lipoprotein n=1 Tax=Roseomonas acroporae TaxID=2937791 RepID=A0A9X2BUM7_9PROT|nr:hypothetical protein [Roseomonas acroporae]MCK8785803.1 hypothetical protein [Roseomonas acroporae]
MVRAALVPLLLLAGCASPDASAPGPVAGAPGVSAAARAAEALPPMLASFRRSGPVTDFEQRPGGAGLGAAVPYAPTGGERMAATVFIYDRGRRPPDGDGPEVAAEFRLAAAELDAAMRAGIYRSVSFANGMGVRSAATARSFRCANFRITQQDGAPTGSSLCVAVQRGMFVKVRLTAWQPPDPGIAGIAAAALTAAVLQARDRTTEG